VSPVLEVCSRGVAAGTTTWGGFAGAVRQGMVVVKYGSAGYWLPQGKAETWLAGAMAGDCDMGG
jgi:hypothetical protein